MSTTGTFLRASPMRVPSRDLQVAQSYEMELVNGDSLGAFTERDVIYHRHAPATVKSKVALQVTLRGHTAFAAVRFLAMNGEVASVSDQGEVSRVSDGVANVLVDAGYVSRVVDVVMSSASGAVINIPSAWVAGSLGEQVAASIDSRIAGQTAESMNLFTDATFSTWNPARWCAELDLTCLSTLAPPCVAISPLHVLMADHYPTSSAKFIAADGAAITRTIVDDRRLGVDRRVGLLSELLPASITPVAVMPSNWNLDRLPGYNKLRVPVLRMNQFRQATVGDLYAVDDLISCRTPTDAQRLVLYRDIINLDSGSPAFLVISSQAILLTTWWGGGGGTGPNYSDGITEINAAMTELGGGYQLTQADLSGFPVY